MENLGVFQGLKYNVRVEESATATEHKPCRPDTTVGIPGTTGAAKGAQQRQLARHALHANIIIECPSSSPYFWLDFAGLFLEK